MQAIILVGGIGRRLYPLTQNVPKPMLLVDGRPIVHRQIEILYQKGVDSITIVAGYQGEQVVDYFSKLSFAGLTINILMEQQPLGTAGATRMALDQMSKDSEPILLAPGDSLFDFDLAKIALSHEKSSAVLTAILVPMHSPYGIVQINSEQRVVSFWERPYLPYPMMSGVYMASWEVLNYLPIQGDMKLMLPVLVREKELHVYLTSRYWKSVETAKDLDELEGDVRENRMFQNTTHCSPDLNYSDLRFEE